VKKGDVAQLLWTPARPSVPATFTIFLYRLLNSCLPLPGLHPADTGVPPGQAPVSTRWLVPPCPGHALRCQVNSASSLSVGTGRTLGESRAY
jgi:hypothetical protein